MGYFSQISIDEWIKDSSQVDIPDTLCESKCKQKTKTDSYIKRAHYSYSGPVYIFDTKVEEYWIGRTMAKSAKEASRNLAYQYKRDHKWPIRSPIILPNPIVLEE